MTATTDLHDAGQSLWLDNITRDLLDSGTLDRYIRELSVTGLTSNPTIYDKAIAASEAYDVAIRKGSAAGMTGEDSSSASRSTTSSAPPTASPRYTRAPRAWTASSHWRCPHCWHAIATPPWHRP